MSALRLTPRRLFSEPALTGSAPLDLRFTPDGNALTYLRPAEDDRERMDLWLVDLDGAEHRKLLDAREIQTGGSDPTNLSDAERAERERRRQFSHGVTSYNWHPDGRRLLIPSDGHALLLDPADANRALPIAPLDTRQSAFQLSPAGRYVSYVRDGDLYAWEIQDSRELRLTDDASETVSNGLSDFLAAEEMHRFEGHWWAPDDSYLVYTRVDESPVPVSYRLEMKADGIRTVEQRYPYAGEANPIVELWLRTPSEPSASRIWKEQTDEAYLGRVLVTAEAIFILTQDRLQQRLKLQRRARGSDTWVTLYEQHSATWINLTDDLRSLDDGRLLFSSEASGTRQPLLLGRDGAVTPLTGPTHTNRIVGATDDCVWVTGWQEDPQQNHLYAIDLKAPAGKPQQITEGCGWHEVVMAKNCDQFVDRFSTPQLPFSVTLVKTRSGERTTIQDGRPDHQHPYHPYLPVHAQACFGSVEAEDGQLLYYRLTPPATIRGRHATIVYVYGGPGPQKARRDWGTLLVQMFAQQGFAVLELDNRGSGNRGARFEAPIYRSLGGVEVVDQLRGLTVLEGFSWADPNRVGVFGHSYGGYLTLMCLCRAPQRFHAGVAVAPVSDWHLYDTHYTERYMGLPSDNVEGYADADVVNHLQHLSAPLLLMHGMADDNVLFTHSTRIMSKLQHLAKPFELMTYPGAKHSMQEREVSIHRFNMILDFFSRTLSQPLAAQLD